MNSYSIHLLKTARYEIVPKSISASRCIKLKIITNKQKSKLTAILNADIFVFAGHRV